MPTKKRDAESTPTRTERAKAGGRSAVQTTKLVAAVVLLVVIVIFVAENGRDAQISFVGQTVKSYLWLALLIAAAFGFVLGLLAATLRSRRK